jgi:hypothetical protein
MQMSNKRLSERLLDLGWSVEHGFQYTYVGDARTGRTGKIPYAQGPLRRTLWPTWLWDQVKRDLNLQGEEIHGRPRQT